MYSLGFSSEVYVGKVGPEYDPPPPPSVSRRRVSARKIEKEVFRSASIRFRQALQSGSRKGHSWHGAGSGLTLIACVCFEWQYGHIFTAARARVTRKKNFFEALEAFDSKRKT